MDAAKFDWAAFSKSHESPQQAQQPQIPQPPQQNSVVTSNLPQIIERSLSTDNSLTSPETDKAITEALTNLNIKGSESTIPLSISLSKLSTEESNTYLRWYNDLTIRKHAKLINVVDVFEFLKNFNLNEKVKNYLRGLFANQNLNIGQFCALLRLISHYIYNLTQLNKDVLPSRKYLLTSCKIPQPKSILATSSIDDDNENTQDSTVSPSLSETSVTSPTEQKIDLDSFAKFIMTGEKPITKTQSPIKKKKNKKAKRVKFSDQLVTVAASSIKEFSPVVSNSSSIPAASSAIDPTSVSDSNLDLSLPMDKLLEKLKNKTFEKQRIEVNKISDEEIKEEKEILGENFNHFQKVNIESALVNGQTAAIPQELVPSDQQQQQQESMQPLKPTLTGSANYLLKSTNNPPANYNHSLINNNATASSELLSPSYLLSNANSFSSSISPQPTSSTSRVSSPQPLQSLQNSQNLRSVPPPPLPRLPRARSGSLNQMSQIGMQQIQQNITTPSLNSPIGNTYSSNNQSNNPMNGINNNSLNIPVNQTANIPSNVSMSNLAAYPNNSTFGTNNSNSMNQSNGPMNLSMNGNFNPGNSLNINNGNMNLMMNNSSFSPPVSSQKNSSSFSNSSTPSPGFFSGNNYFGNNNNTLSPMVQEPVNSNVGNNLNGFGNLKNSSEDSMNLSNNFTVNKNGNSNNTNLYAMNGNSLSFNNLQSSQNMPAVLSMNNSNNSFQNATMMNQQQPTMSLQQQSGISMQQQQGGMGAQQQQGFNSSYGYNYSGGNSMMNGTNNIYSNTNSNQMNGMQYGYGANIAQLQQQQQQQDNLEWFERD